MDKVSQSVPSEDIDDDELDLSRNIPLADPEFHRSAGVDGLIGLPLFWDLRCDRSFNLADKNMQLRNTELGEIVTGDYGHKEATIQSNL